MKKLLIASLCFIFCYVLADAQVMPGGRAIPAPRRISFKYINKDSVNLALSDNFEMIEDSCSQIIRYAHVDMRQRKFMGKITDVSRANPQLILTEGNYNTDGLKDGYFIVRFFNGNLQAKGNFKSGAYDGKWEIYYDDNKPRLTFEANGADIKIMDAWDNKGIKIIDNGKGNYRVDLGEIYWKGKLLNGKPEGTWKAMRTDDATNTELLIESYKNGVFQKGGGPIGNYTDASRLTLVSPRLLPFTEAESLRISMVPCDGVKHKHIVSAQYSNGLVDFSDHIKTASREALKGFDIGKLEDSQLILNGEVATNGNIIKLIPQNMFNDPITKSIIQQFNRLPPLHPATVDSTPVTQKFVITYSFSKGVYWFNYRFLPIE